MYKIVLIRHGESQWNLENRFTGWVDVDLSEKGREEAKKGGQALKKEGYVFDVAFTSVLKRAIHTPVSYTHLSQIRPRMQRGRKRNTRQVTAVFPVAAQRGDFSGIMPPQTNRMPVARQQ